MVFQSYALYPHMTVRENLEFPLKLRKMPKDEINRKVDQAAEILGITQYLDRKPKALSGGAASHASLRNWTCNRARTKSTLMDEPLSNRMQNYGIRCVQSSSNCVRELILRSCM